MTLTVRIPPRVEQELAEYCAKRKVTKSQAVKEALGLLLEDRTGGAIDHPFIGGDTGDGSDVSGNVKQLLRERFRKAQR